MNLFQALQSAITTPEQLADCFAFGLEREALRVTPEGNLSQTDHPAAFGHPAKHPNITLDFAENQLEFLTPVLPSIDEAVKYLEQLQAWIQSQLDNELLWPLSMPPTIKSPDEVRIAYFGEESAHKEKEIYRRGLAERYGKLWQTICGVHYNFSFSDSFWRALFGECCPEEHQAKKDELYLAMVRNFLRYRFVPVYLFGASPVAGEGYDHDNSQTPYAVSVRMSKYGYSNSEQRGGGVLSYNSVSQLIEDYTQMLTTKKPEYEAIGTKRDGEQIQLNTNLLQVPAEYYGPIRLKSPSKTGDALRDLQTEGISHIEVRAVDLCPHSPIGICPSEFHFLHVFLIWCLIKESPEYSDQERTCANQAQTLTALRGRDPELVIECEHQAVPLREKALAVIDQLRPVAKWLDSLSSKPRYVQCIEHFKERAASGNTDSAEMIEQMRAEGLSHHEYGLKLARESAEKMAAVEMQEQFTSQFTVR